MTGPRVRSLAAILSALAMAALVALPALHGTHGAHPRPATAAAAPAGGLLLEAGVPSGPTACPVCIGVAQARIALVAAFLLVVPARRSRPAAPRPATAELVPARARAPGAPRAPPAFA